MAYMLPSSIIPWSLALLPTSITLGHKSLHAGPARSPISLTAGRAHGQTSLPEFQPWVNPFNPWSCRLHAEVAEPPELALSWMGGLLFSCIVPPRFKSIGLSHSPDTKMAGPLKLVLP
eukprot:1159696-Pelagomonas_calceolata.AAC.1